jgi:hypothetical protein
MRAGTAEFGHRVPIEPHSHRPEGEFRPQRRVAGEKFAAAPKLALAAPSVEQEAGKESLSPDPQAGNRNGGQGMFSVSRS